MSAAWFATQLDFAMLQKALVTGFDPHHLPERTGAEVAAELQGRALLRYLALDGMHERGSQREVFVTPTPYAPDDLGAYLALPRADLARTYALWLDPRMIDTIKGPRWVIGGQGIEYILPHGYPDTAIMPPGWGVKVR